MVLTFEDKEKKEIEFGEDDLRWIVDKIKNVIQSEEELLILYQILDILNGCLFLYTILFVFYFTGI